MMKEKTPKYFTAYDRLKDVKTLIKEYTDSLGIDLSFQSFEKEMSDLKGKYGSPRGSMHLCYVDDEVSRSPELSEAIEAYAFMLCG